MCLDGACVFLDPASACDPSATAPCGPLGSCSGDGALYTCACPPDRSGAACESCAEGFHPIGANGLPGTGEDQSDEALESGGLLAAPDFTCEPDQSCADLDCGPFGGCSEVSGLAVCECEAGHTGPTCESCLPYYDHATDGSCLLGETCSARLCGSRGACVSLGDELQCVCDEGFAGERCERCADGFRDDGQTCVPVETCTPDACGSGKCSDSKGEIVCTCKAGFGGDDCTESCLGETCSDRGACVFEGGSPVCICDHPELLPESSCATCAPGLELHVDATGAVHCDLTGTCEDTCVGGTCVTDPTNGAAVCQCEPGYTGVTCGRCSDGALRVGDACLFATDCDLTLCSGRGSCAVDGGQVSCDCKPGSMGDDCSQDLPIAGFAVSGHDETVTWGGTTDIEVAPLGVGHHDEMAFELLTQFGTLEPLGEGKVRYHAPTNGGDAPQVVSIEVGPACCPGQAMQLGVYASPAVMPGAAGPVNPALAGIDKGLVRFMFDRCAGKQVQPNTPVRIGSTTKAVTAAMVRQIIEARLFFAGRLPEMTQNDTHASWRTKVDLRVESVRLLDADLNLVPKVLRDILGSCTWDGSSYACEPGAVPPPAKIDVADTKPPGACDGGRDNVCYNGGMCGPDPNNNGKFKCSCPFLYTGATCSKALWFNPVFAPNGADSRWLGMTMGHLFTHKAGLPRDAISTSTVVDNLFALRGYHDPSFASNADVGEPLHLVNADFPAPGPGEATPRVLEEPQSTYEYVLAETGRNLNDMPGSADRVYSNTAFMILTLLIEHMSGQPDWELGGIWGGKQFSHETHVGSPLSTFVQANLARPHDDNPWGAQLSRYGMFAIRTPNVNGGPWDQHDPEQMKARGYSSDTWDPENSDSKSPVCDPTPEGGCVWTFGTVDSYGNAGKVPYGTGYDAMLVGAGYILSEVESYLRFMRKFYVASTSSWAGYGRPRTSWSLSATHDGNVSGGRAFAYQIGWNVDPIAQCTAKWVKNDGGDVCPPGEICCKDKFDCVDGTDVDAPVSGATIGTNQCVAETRYRVPFIHMPTGDYIEPSVWRGCVLPEGLDVFASTNRRSDSADADLDVDMVFLGHTVVRGLCEAQWPASPLQLNVQLQQLLGKKE